MSRLLRSGRWVAVFLVIGVGVGFRADPAAAPEKAPVKLETASKRRGPTEEDLRKQLQSLPEVGFDQPTAGELYAPVIKAMRVKAPVRQLPADLGFTTIHEKAAKENRPDVVLLPWNTGPDNELTKEDAEHLQSLSTKLRAALRKSSFGRDERPDADTLSPLLTNRKEWTTPAAVPTLTQMMQAESTGVRLLLVDMLAKIGGREASTALARRAIFDLSPDVRSRAVRALAPRRAIEYTEILYDGFRYPWPAAADHAADAVIELKRVDMVPGLVKLLKEPSPTAPVKAQGGYTVREVVRINHLCNCVLCHSPSLEKEDPVRRNVPIPGERIAVYYDRSAGDYFVRADRTYLRQGFSVAQPVEKPGNWPAEQRYDYLVRTRPLSKTEQAEFEKSATEDKAPKTYPQRMAVLYTLRELTGWDHGTTFEGWSEGLRKSSLGGK